MGSLVTGVIRYANTITSLVVVVFTRKQKRFGKKPWLSQGLRTSIDKKDELYNLSKKDPTFIEKYKSHSNLLRKLIKKVFLCDFTFYLSFVHLFCIVA